MDASAVNSNVTVDDFDSLLSYLDQGAWETPDPSSSSFNTSTSQWLMGTYHSTNATNATVSFNFTGPAIYLFGAAGPVYGSYEVLFDGVSSTRSVYVVSNALTPCLLYCAVNLTYTAHTLTLHNLGKQGTDAGGREFLFDFLRATLQLAPVGATVTNQTLEEMDAALTYSGTCSSTTLPNFSRGGSTFTNADNVSVALSFHGLALYVFRDKKNDHRLYSVVLDSSALQIFDSISGCGSAFGMTCDITNMASVNKSYFDLDSIVLSILSKYAPRSLVNVLSTMNDSSSASPSASPGSNATLLLALNLFLTLGVLWLVWAHYT
ncbi:hypothetical protein DFH07DRAFT_865656 [Mycena maculata]|uniref:Transmembrane protein n=1 Tax=Mycena maculata TaxID=230809 RepID=A0AAD7K2E2_9AGAR|nr:hypothetical protein DFH07DRAFT_865656 [Mycena maculata]